MGIGGAEIVNVSLSKQFLDRGFRVDFVTGWNEPDSHLLPLPDAARHFVLGAKQTRGVLLPFARYLLKERPDAVIVSMWPFTTTCVLAHRLVRSRARIIVWEHSTLSVQYADRGFIHGLALRKSIRFVYPQAYGRVAVSSGVANDLAALSGVARHRFTVIHNPMSLSLNADIDESQVEAAWRGWRGPRILTVGRLKSVKNHSLLIRAFKRLLAKQDARLLILGTGELAEATAAVARVEGVADKVLMPGATVDPTPYYRSADLFALSSDREGFANVVIEALACGLPVVSTDCKSGPSEILENGRYGRLVPVGDADALANAMLEVLAAEHDREALKRRAADFAPEIIADQFLRLLFPQSAGAAAAAIRK